MYENNIFYESFIKEKFKKELYDQINSLGVHVLIFIECKDPYKPSSNTDTFIFYSRNKKLFNITVNYKGDRKAIIDKIINDIKQGIINNYNVCEYYYSYPEAKIISEWKKEIENENINDQIKNKIKEKMRDIIEKSLDDCIEEVMDTFKKEAYTNETNN